MQRELLEPLEPGEEVMRVQVEVSEWIPSCSEPQIRARVLHEFYRYAEMAQYEVLRSPEISLFHRPEYPGDVAMMVALGVGRPAMR